MKKTLVFLSLILALGSTSARAEWTYPVLNDYQAIADSLVAATQSARSADDVAAVAARHRDLVRTGIALLSLYAEKNPVCAEQFKVVGAEAATAESLTFEQANKRFHDGEGLPAAPKHCYFGRGEVAHPILNLIRLKGEWNEKVRTQVLDDLEEVIEHLSRVQKNLDKPPV